MVKTTLGKIGFPLFFLTKKKKRVERNKKIEKSNFFLNLKVVYLAKWAVLGKVVFKQMYTVELIQRGAGVSVSRTLKVPAYAFCLTAPFFLSV